jgi:aminoglycoside phosphotransferase (APT) family kinase protein
MFSENLTKLLQELEPDAYPIKIERLEGGLSADMYVATLRFFEGTKRKYVIRQANHKLLASNPEAASQEYLLLTKLYNAGLPVPKPYYFSPNSAGLERPSVVMEWLRGTPCYNSAAIPNFAEQYANALALLHHNTGLLREVPWLKPYQAELPHMPKHNQRLPKLREAQRNLARIWPIPSNNPSGLLHGDFWPGNLLWSAKRLRAIVDWEDAATGDPLIDLAISRFDLYWIDSPETMQRFTQHYLQRNPINTRYLAAWDLFAALRIARMALEDLNGWVAFFHDKGHPKMSAAHFKRRFAEFVAQALAAL